jgi:tRNA modification GTPase
MAADTIAAIATPPGFGGVGVVRVSGPGVCLIAEAILGRIPEPRLATLRWFRDETGAALDQGLALFFPGPHSFTGEDVLELQGHGGPLVLDLILKRLVALGARLARPGEFSERAFLNGKLDLAQAEAVADLISSGTEEAARLAGRNLQGEFSRRIQELVEELIHLRAFVEAALDFPEEEIDFMANSSIAADLEKLVVHLDKLLAGARQGCLIREGIQVVIAGPPNVGKSSLLNALAGSNAAIVTAIPGTTRDLLHQHLQIDGLPLHIIDTAGLRHSDHPVEMEGIRRARDQIAKADAILWLSDDSQDPAGHDFEPTELPTPATGQIPVTWVRNKIDLSGRPPGLTQTTRGAEIAISAREGRGLDSLRAHLKHIAGYQEQLEGAFLARRRHLDALTRAREALCLARTALWADNAAELTAEELRITQQALGEITGEFTSEDLLGKIFASFCVGK